MKEKILSWMYALTTFQLVIYLLGFYNFAAKITNHAPLFSSDLDTLSGIFYWSLLSMVSVVGIVLASYLVFKHFFKNNVGLVLSIIAFASPLIFMLFLIIPATFCLLAIIFLKISVSDEGEAHYEN